MRTATARPFLAAVVLLASARPAPAAVLQVVPGPGTPLQDAIAAAAPGDTIKVADGDYSGAIVVDKAIRILGDSRSPRVDAGCGVANALEVTADGAEVKNFVVAGGSVNGVVVEGRSGVELTNMGITNACDATGAGVRLVGVTDLRLRNVRGTGHPIGTYVADLAAGARVRLVYCGGQGSLFGGMDTGVLIENVAAGALELAKCQVGYAVDAGIDLRNADGVRIRTSVVLGRGEASTSRGIVLDADSSDNSITRNYVRLNDVDAVDLGVSNCWRANNKLSGVPLTGNASEAGCP